MSQLTSQPNEPDRSDSTAPKQTTTSDARPPWLRRSLGDEHRRHRRVRAFEIRELGGSYAHVPLTRGFDRPVPALLGFRSFLTA